jgi:hypothetical protein
LIYLTLAGGASTLPAFLLPFFLPHRIIEHKGSHRGMYSMCVYVSMRLCGKELGDFIGRIFATKAQSLNYVRFAPLSLRLCGIL